MKGLEQLKSELRKVNNELILAEKLRDEVIEKEVSTLKEIIEYFDDAIPYESINGMKATLIYIFEANNKRTISNKVYFCEDGKIRYQVYKKDEYLGYNPEAVFEGSYAVVDAGEMFKNIDLSDVLQFFDERVTDIPEKSKDIKEDTFRRSKFIE